MNIVLYSDDTISVKMTEIVKNLNRVVRDFRFNEGKGVFSISSNIISKDKTYTEIEKTLLSETMHADEVLMFTEKRYDNNYFWDSDGKYSIVSFWGWKHLTNLSRNNGVAYFCCAIILRNLFTTHDKNTGCINDMWIDKTGIDVGMRTAYICPKCMSSPKRFSIRDRDNVIKDLTAALNDISAASRNNMDICDYWEKQTKKLAFDVFLCHNSQEKDTIRLMNRRLKKSRVRTWLDEEQLPPGQSWQDLLEKQIEQIKTAAIFVGKSGIGPWQEEEIKAFLREFVRRKCPVIPVILKDCSKPPELPLFLSQFTWVDFRISEPDPYEQLLWGIKGRKTQSKQSPL
jgi:hypothetical protein